MNTIEIVFVNGLVLVDSEEKTANKCPEFICDNKAVYN